MSTEQLAVRPHVATEKCPWCGSTISRERFEEIEERIAEEERRKLSEERGRMSKQLDIAVQKMREEAEAKVAEMTTERDLAVKEAAAQAEAKTKGELSTRLAALAEERDRVNAKLQEQEEANEKVATERDLAVKEAAAQAEAKAKEELGAQLSAVVEERDQTKAILKERDTAGKKDLADQRAALERDRDLQLRKLRTEHNREREQFQKQIEILNRKAQHKTADELGESAEVDVYERLHEAFSSDDIKRVKRGARGADIRQDVLYKGEACGTILIDSKDRKGWQSSYVTKLREDQIAAKAEHAILATNVFPQGKKEIYVDKVTRVIVVNRARAVEIIGLLRAAMIQMNTLRLSQIEKTDKREKLYNYISSEIFHQHLDEASRLSSGMLDLDVEEKRAHETIWQRRGKMAIQMRNTVGNIETEVSAIVERRSSSRERAK